ncbi:MAG TPA: DUF998 domain-containing protein, partial [Polyangiaceae bacterium]
MAGVNVEPSPRTDAERDARLARRLGAWAGFVGPCLFVATFTVEGWLRPGYSATAMFVSALSLGSRGWVQIVNFITVGLSFLAFARGVAAQFATGTASRAAPILLGIIGLSLIGSGPFVMDAVGTQFPEMSFHGQLHQLLGASVFSLGPVSAFVLFRRFRADPSWRPMAGWTFAAGIVITAAVVLLKLATLPPPASPNVLTAWVGL